MGSSRPQESAWPRAEDATGGADSHAPFRYFIWLVRALRLAFRSWSMAFKLSVNAIPFSAYCTFNTSEVGRAFAVRIPSASQHSLLTSMNRFIMPAEMFRTSSGLVPRPVPANDAAVPSARAGADRPHSVFSAHFAGSSRREE